MKRLRVLFICLISLVFAEAELKVYGIVSYLSQDNTSLNLGDLTVILSKSTIEGVLTVGSLVEIEGFWQGQTFYATEVEVEHPQAEVFIYQGLVQDGKLFGLEVPDLDNGLWLKVIAQHTQKGLILLLIKPLTSKESRIQATVEELTPDGFIAGHVRIVSSRDVTVGEWVIVKGQWNGYTLTETP